MDPVSEYYNFFVVWHDLMRWVFLIGLGIIPTVCLVYWLRLTFQRTPKAKYDFMSQREQRVWKIANVFFALVEFAIINHFIVMPERTTIVHFTVLLAVSVVVSIAHIYFSFLFVNVYYPNMLTKKLKKLRYRPRINPKTGNTMKLLGEEEEDKYLDEGMQAEEEVFSVDYDVWIDEKTGETLIEKYSGNLEAHTCSSCGFQTLRLIKEEIIDTEETTDQKQKVKQHYHCSYCKNDEEEIINLKHATEDTLSAMAQVSVGIQTQAIKISIISEEGSTQVYDFQNIDQARNFLNEYKERLESKAPKPNTP